MFFFSNSSAVSVNSRRRRCRSATGRRQQTNRWFDSMEINKKKARRRSGHAQRFIGFRRLAAGVAQTDRSWWFPTRSGSWPPVITPRWNRESGASSWAETDRRWRKRKLDSKSMISFHSRLFCSVSGWSLRDPSPSAKPNAPKRGHDPQIRSPVVMHNIQREN